MKKIVFITITLLVLLLGIFWLSGMDKRLNEMKNPTPSSSQQTGQLETGSFPQAQNMGAVEASVIVQITSPSDKSTVTSASVTVRGKTLPLAEVFINDKETKSDDDGNFSSSITLDEGENVIMVVVNDSMGQAGEAEITVTYVAEQAIVTKGTVASKSADILEVKDTDGKEYVVKFDSKTQFRRRFWGKSSINEIQVGHTATVIGKWLNDQQLQMQAVLIRDVSIQKRNGVFFGNVSSVSSTGFVMATKARGNQIVTVSNSTRMINRIGATIGQSTIAIGHRVRVTGLWDTQANTITEVTQVKDFDLP